MSMGLAVERCWLALGWPFYSIMDFEMSCLTYRASISSIQAHFSGWHFLRDLIESSLIGGMAKITSGSSFEASIPRELTS